MNQTKKIILSKQQKEIMQLFYAVAPTKIVILKENYEKLWDTLKDRNLLFEKEKDEELNCICPAIVCEIQKSIATDRLLQSAVFSECVYAQTLANIFRLPVFQDYAKNNAIDESVLVLLGSYGLVPRYIYANEAGTELLIQAGSCEGVDGALIHLTDNAMYSIEFKEPGARVSTADLPKYGEDGKMIITQEFIKKYSFYEDMLHEQKDLNFFDTMGHNTYAFSPESIRKAIVNSYSASATKKYADVIVTVDKSSYLVMLPANQADVFARLEGEIRGARNVARVWTPNKLAHFIGQLGGSIDGNNVSISADKFATSKPRGGKGISRYKINPIFFVRAKDVTNTNGIISFRLDKVQQLIPCITAKMFFEDLEYEQVFTHYKEDLQ